jgi:hypothetical protein
LLKIFQQVFASGKVPKEWQVIKQVPIPKSGDLNELANWRPICLLNIVAKLYNRVLYNRLIVLDSNMRYNQSGFRRNRSVEEQQACLVHLISSVRRLQRGSLIIVFIDFAKAFPSTSWVAIRAALEAFHVPGELIRAIMSMYTSDLRAYVQIGESRTEEFGITVGTLQGDVLAPYLFDIVLDRVMATAMQSLSAAFPREPVGIPLQPMKLTQTRVSQRGLYLTDVDFADDIGLLSYSESFDEARIRAQRLLSAVAMVAAKANLKMKAGPQKTAMMYFGTGPAAAVSTDIFLGADLVPVVEKYRDLGRVVGHKLGRDS